MPGESSFASISSDEIQAQLARVLDSPVFAKSERMSALLRYLAEQSLHGTPEKLKEYAIGVDVFQKDVSFDPRLDTTVRSEARRLRIKLEEYYQGAGQDDPVEIALPKGAYRLTFHPRGRSTPADASLPSASRWAGFRWYAPMVNIA